MHFGISKKKEEYVLSFSIGSARVAGAAFVPQKSGNPKIIFSAAEPIEIDEELDLKRFSSKTLKALEKVAEKLHEEALGAPVRIFCTLLSPWYFSQARIIRLEKNTPFIFTEKVADDLIQREIKLFSEEHLVPHQGSPHAIRTIELKNIKTMLNGYETAEPLYKKAKELEMTVFISVAEEVLLNKIESVIRKYFGFEAIKFSSFAVSSFTVARDIDHKRENFLLIDVGGEVTEIFMVKRGVLRDSISFPLGRNFITRRVATELGSTLSEADSLLSLHKDGHAEEAVRSKLDDIMAKIQKDWLVKFQESLAHLSGDISIPATVYITADTQFLDLFINMIKAEQFSQYTLAESKFEITPLDTRLLHELAVFETSSAPDPFLIIDAIYINRFLLKI